MPTASTSRFEIDKIHGGEHADAPVIVLVLDIGDELPDITP